MNNGLLLGLGALVVGGGIAWLAFNDDTQSTGVHPDDVRLDAFGYQNNIEITVPNDRTLSPRTNNGDYAGTRIGKTFEPVASLTYFPSTNSLYVFTATGWMIDQQATNSWLAFQAADRASIANAATRTVNAPTLLNFEPI